MDTDTHGCGALASSRSTGRRLEQNYMVMFWQNPILERQAQRQLQDARVAGAGDAHEVRAVLRRGRVVEIDPVQRIEHFEAELRVEPLLDREVLHHAEIGSGEAGSKVSAAAQIAVCSDSVRR